MKLSKNLSEVFFIMVGISWFIDNLLEFGHINYIALLVIWLMFLQVIYKNRVLGIVYGAGMAVFSLFTLYRIFFLYPDSDTFSLGLMLLGTVINGAGVVVGGRMLYKYLTTDKKYEENALTISF